MARVVLVLLVWALPSCVSTSRNPRPEAADLCYSLADARWDPVSMDRIGSGLDPLPDRIRLTGLPAVRHPELPEGGIILGDLFPWDSSRVAYFENEAGTDSVNWRALKSDSVLVGQGHGFGHFYLRGVRRDDRMVGTFHWSVDNVRYAATAEVDAPLISCADLGAQGGPIRVDTLSVADSVSAWVSAAKGALEHALPDFDLRVRIWAPAAALTEDFAEGSLPLSPAVRSGLHEAFPSMELVDSWPAFFVEIADCPDGVRLAMPDSGCPFLEDGIALLLAPLESGPSGGIETRVSIVTSHDLGEGRTPSRRWLTSMSTFTVRLRRSESGDWRVVEIALHSIT